MGTEQFFGELKKEKIQVKRMYDGDKPTCCMDSINGNNIEKGVCPFFKWKLLTTPFCAYLNKKLEKSRYFNNPLSDDNCLFLPKQKG